MNQQAGRPRGPRRKARNLANPARGSMANFAELVYGQALLQAPLRANAGRLIDCLSIPRFGYLKPRLLADLRPHSALTVGDRPARGKRWHINTSKREACQGPSEGEAGDEGKGGSH